MDSRLVLLFFLNLNSTFASDWVVKYFNQYSLFDLPCDDFFRQVCPLNGYIEGFDTMVDRDMELLASKQGVKPWQNLQIRRDLTNVYESYLSKINGNVPQLVINKFEIMCENKENTTSYLGVLEQIYEELRRQDATLPTFRISTLSEDRNCSRAAEQLLGVIEDKYYNKPFEFETHPLMEIQGAYNLEDLHNTAKAAMLTTDESVRKGIEVVEKMVERMKEIAIKNAKVTPWLINSGTVDIMSRIISQVRMQSDFLSTFEQVSNIMLSLEQNYLQCKTELSIEQQEFDYTSVIICSFLAEIKLAEYPVLKKPSDDASLELNAFNAHPELSFAIPLFYYAGSSADMASILGFVGTTVGHELGHTIVKDYVLVDNLVPYFSNKTRDCIQNQFNSTCSVFNENGCSVDPSQIDENGSDFFGLNIAYQLLKDHYGHRLNDKHPKINLTYHQLFFYATNLFECDEGSFGKHYPNQEKDPHSVGKIRANTIVQNPGFQEAFQCANNSRMMKSKTKTCHILGKEAFKTR